MINALIIVKSLNDRSTPQPKNQKPKPRRERRKEMRDRLRSEKVDSQKKAG